MQLLAGAESLVEPVGEKGLVGRLAGGRGRGDYQPFPFLGSARTSLEIGVIVTFESYNLSPVLKYCRVSKFVITALLWLKWLREITVF